jgi:hypothetical protein
MLTTIFTLIIKWIIFSNLAFFQNYTEVLSGMIIEYNLFYIQLGDLKQNHAIIIHKTIQMIQIRPGITTCIRVMLRLGLWY